MSLIYRYSSVFIEIFIFKIATIVAGVCHSRNFYFSRFFLVKSKTHVIFLIFLANGAIKFEKDEDSNLLRVQTRGPEK